MNFVINDSFGIHARVATQIINLIERYGAEVLLKCGNKCVSGDSIFALMQLGTKKGDILKIEYIKPPFDLEAFESEMRKILEG